MTYESLENSMNKKKIVQLLGAIIVAVGTGCQSLKYSRHGNLAGREVSGDTGQAYGFLEVLSSTRAKVAPKLGNKWSHNEAVVIEQRGVFPTGDPKLDAIAAERFRLYLLGEDIFVLKSSRKQDSTKISGIVITPRLDSVAFDPATGERWSKVSSYRIIQARLLANGMLLVDESDNDHQLFESFMYFQDKARRLGRGVWAGSVEDGEKE